MEKALSWILRGGVALSSVLVGIGLVWMLVVSGSTDASSLPHTGVVPAAPAGPGMLIQVGIAILLCTPVTRVVASCLMFARRREWWFVAMTVWVLLAMGVGLILAWY